MPLTAKDWIENSTPEMLTQIRKNPPENAPASLALCQQDPNWWKMFRLFLDKVEFSGENVFFLDAVDKFKKQPTVESAREVYQKFVSRDAARQVNLADWQAKSITQWYLEPDIFDVAYKEVGGGEDPDRDGAFRTAVDLWRQSGRSFDGARTIYDDHVREGAVGRVSLLDKTRTDLVETLDAGPNTAGFFDAAYTGIFELMKDDSYPRFKVAATAIRPGLEAALEEGTGISRPGKLEAPQARRGQPTANKPDQRALNDWNKKALNALREGNETDFFQVGDVVVIANAAAGMPPGVVWAQQQGAAIGKITMIQKGGAFDPGSIKAQGASDFAALKRAVASVSKKRVDPA